MTHLRVARWAVPTLLVVLAANSATAQQQLDEMSLDRWAKLRETERYQLQIAEKYYREKNWKVATGEYEKFLTLYEDSEGAPYAQLKWSLALVQLRKANTAIKDGFQSVIDYWPESDDAVAAAYYIGNTYKQIGQTAKAKKAYGDMLSRHPKHLAAVYAMVDLIDMAVAVKDTKTCVEFWKKLTFDVPRGRLTNPHCHAASRSLANYYFEAVAFDDAVKALATTYAEQELPPAVVQYASGPITRLAAQSETKAKAEKLADLTIAYLRQAMPTAADEEAKKVAVQTMYLIADVQSYAGRDAEVPKVYDEIAKRFGNSDEALGRLAAWYRAKQKYDEARAVYRRYENKVEGLNLVAATFRQEQNYNAAIETFNLLLAQDADNSNRWKAEIAATYRSIPKYPEAIAVYTQLLDEDLEHAESWRWQIATAHRDAGQLKEAIGHFRQCTNFPENFKQMAWCHRRLNQHNEALLLYNQIVGSHPPSAPWALLQIGYTREEAGQKESAINTFQQVCKRYPEDSHASVAHAHLQNKYKLSITLGGAKDE
jgi:tetratricopeptide (TPR) repeat protein